MKTIQLYFGIFLSIFIFSSCEKNIEFNGDISDSKLVINSYITPDSVVSAQVSESRFFLSDSTTFNNINNADVAVWVNGTFKEKMSFVRSGIYKGTYKPAVGETIRLVVNAPSKKEVTCETKINPRPVISSIDTSSVRLPQQYILGLSDYSQNGSTTTWKYDTLGTMSGRNINYKFMFNDNANEKNYYRLVVLEKKYYIKTDAVTNIKTITESDYYWSNLTDLVSGNNTNSDPVSLIGGNSVFRESYNIFTDDLFNGKTYLLSFSTTQYTYNYRPYYKYWQDNPYKISINISLQSISKDYYLYLKSRVAATNSSDSFFSEPIQIYNNITGGIGIFGSYTSSNVFKYDL